MRPSHGFRLGERLLFVRLPNDGAAANGVLREVVGILVDLGGISLVQEEDGHYAEDDGNQADAPRAPRHCCIAAIGTWGGGTTAAGGTIDDDSDGGGLATMQ